MIEWKAEFETGIPSADHEHRKLIELVNELHEKARVADTVEEAAQSLDRIVTQFTAHFAHEEEAMRDMGYAEFAGHKADHDRLIAEVEQALAAVRQGTELAVDFPARLENWFTGHFKTLDMPLHRFLDRVA